VNTLFPIIFWLAWLALAAVPWAACHANYFANLALSFHGVLSAIWFLLLYTAMGRLLLMVLPVDEVKQDFAHSAVRTIATRLLLSLGLGTGMYAALILGYGTFVGVSYQKNLIFHLTLAIVLVKAWVIIAGELLALAKAVATRPFTRFDRVAGLAVSLALLSLLPFVLTPALFPDTLRYHFGLTKLYTQAGAIQFFPHIAESNISLNWQMLYLGSLTLAGETTAQALNWLFLTAACLAVHLAAAPLGRWIAAAVVISVPSLLAVGSLANNDVGMAFFCALMWLSFRHYDRLKFSSRMSWILCGLFGGFAFGTKYPALLAVVSLAMAWLFLGDRTFLQRLKQPGLMLGGFVAGCSPWLIKNALWTGDPLWPLMARYLPWTSAETLLVVERYARELEIYGGGMTGFARWILAPWRATTESSRYFESELGLLIWFLLPLLLLGFFKSKSARLPVFTTFVFGALWAMGPQITRFLAAGIPIIGIAASESWTALSDRRLRIFGRILTALLCAVSLWTSWLILAGMSNPYDFFLKGMNPHDYRMKHSAAYRMASYLAEEPRKKSKVMLLGVEDVFYIENPLKFDGAFNTKWLIRQAAESTTAEELLEKVQAADINYLLLNSQFAEGLEKKFGYLSWPSPEVRRRFLDLLNVYTELERKDELLELRRVK
jgi:hypothetical protein